MKCFVIMPFGSAFNDVYTTIKAAGKSAMPKKKIGFRRLDEIKRPGRISDDLIREIIEAEFCIADLSGNNPNVMWEAGYAMALNKPIVFISQNIKKLPFDIRDMRTIRYKRQALASTLQSQLAQAIRQTLSEHEASRVDANVDVQRKAAQQIGKSYKVRTEDKRIIDVRILERIGLDPGQPLALTWDTICEDGVEYLVKQIADSPRGVFQDAIILGINELGTIIASYLNGKLWRGDKEIGIVRSIYPKGKMTEKLIFYSSPATFVEDKSRELTILLVDSEIKSGKAVKQIFNDLQKRFKIGKIYFAVLVACKVTCPVEDMTQMRYKKDDGTLEQIPIPIDFLAFFTPDVIETPGRIR